jgi:small subunit ribosomal protein S13
MARIAGVDLPKEKRVEVALTYIYGIGRPSANKILEKANVNKDTRVSKLTETEVVHIRDILEQEYKVEGDLRRDVATNIKRLMDIGSYRGSSERKKRRKSPVNPVRKRERGLSLGKTFYEIHPL